MRAQSEYDRQVGLIESNATSVANVEKWLSERDQAAAQVELAKLNLGYTHVSAPFSGRIGRRLVDPGNLVGPSVNTKLATLDQLEPIYVYFNLNERDTLQAVAIMRQQGLDPRGNIGKTPVFVGLQNQEGYPQEGTLDFVDTGISTSSGTMQLRAIFGNKDHAAHRRGLSRGCASRSVDPSRCWSCRRAPSATTRKAITCWWWMRVTSSPGGAVVKGPLTTNGCAIRSGLTAQDRVIVNGMMRAKPGDKVTPVTAAGRPV